MATMVYPFAGKRDGQDTQAAASGTAPTTAADGFPLEGLIGLVIGLSALVTRTLSGAGTLQCYLYDGQLARWARASSLDLTVPSGASGFRDFIFPAIQVLAPRGRICFVPSGVTISGGTNVVITYFASAPGAVYPWST